MESSEVSIENALLFKPIVQKTGFLTTLTDEQLIHFLTTLRKMTIQTGETLIEAEETGTNFYILIHGRLRVYSDENHKIADILSGDLIGEISPLLQTSRSHTVKAARDSIILEIDQKAFQFLEKTYPSEILRLAKLSLLRLRSSAGRPLEPGEKVETIALVPASTSSLEDFSLELKKELNTFQNATLIKESHLIEKFGRQPYNQRIEQEIIKWMNDLENEANFVIYIGDGSNSDWNKRIIRSADRVLLIAESDLPKGLNPSERFIYSLKQEVKPFIDLVIIHPETTVNVKGTAVWLENRPVNVHHHMKKGYPPHLRRLVRFLTGKAVGIILSGGAAKAIGHLGVLKAIEEMNIPIDFIAGTSMGAVISAGYATFGLETCLKINQTFIQNYSTLPTLPIQAFLTGKTEERLFRAQWDDICIEDLWTHFFCVATDISDYKVKTLRYGEVWKALRATISMPGILPPIYTQEGEILVDGGVLNNLPVDLMRPLLNGGIIIAVNCNVPIKKASRIPDETTYSVSGWSLLFEKLNPFKKAKKTRLSIYSVIIKSLFASTLHSQKHLESLADFTVQLDTSHIGIRDYHIFESAIEDGYRQAKQQLASFYSLKNKENITSDQ